MGYYDYSEPYELGEYDWDEIWAQSGRAQRVGSEVLHQWAVPPEGYGSLECAGIVKTADGYYYAFDAWADTTGWGCRDGVQWYGPMASVVGAAGHLSQEHRRFLGFENSPVPEDIYRDHEA